MKKILIVLILLLVLLLGFIGLRFGAALTQEGNPIPIVTSIMKLELSNNDYQLFSETPNENRYVSETGDYRYDAVKEFMKGKGWEYKEQMGAGLVFEMNGEITIIVTRQYSKYYFIWNVPKEVLN